MYHILKLKIHSTLLQAWHSIAIVRRMNTQGYTKEVREVIHTFMS